jgi:hypothetical protein
MQFQPGAFNFISDTTMQGLSWILDYQAYSADVFTESEASLPF